uniref:Polysaccharide biosynthesis protein n=1 Tax=Geoglobus ahangari TaxID=113653 RepID=A0A7C3UCA2_9EURY
MKKYLKLYLTFSLGTWFKAAITLITAPLISYLITPDEFGRASMYSMFFQVLYALMFLGSDHAFFRFFYVKKKSERRELLWNCLYPSLTTSTIIAVVVFTFGDTISRYLYGERYRYVSLLLIITMYLSLFQRYNASIVRLEKKGFLYSIIEIVNSIATGLSTIVLAKMMRGSFYAVIVGQLIGYLATLIVGLPQFKGYWKPTTVSLRDIRELLVYGLPFVPTFLMGWLFSSIDKISLRQFRTYTEIGLYSVAYKIASALLLVQAGFTLIWGPTAFERYEQNKDDRTFFKKANSVVTFAMFSLGMVVFIFKDLLILLFSTSYRESAQIVPFLILVPVMLAISDTTQIGISISKKTYWHLVTTIMASAANYLGNRLLVPLLGARGAAISTGLSYMFYMFVRLFISERVFPVGYDLRRISASSLVTVTVFAVGMFNRSHVVNSLVGLLGLALIVLMYSEEFKILHNELLNALRKNARNE